MKISRVCVVGATAAAAVLGMSVPAFAHVTVQPEGAAAKGGYAVIDFKVPNERDKASTTKLEVSLPVDEHPLASVSPEPVPGWTVKVTKSKLAKPVEMHGKKIDEAVSKVTWTADGKGVEPGYFQKFPLSVGQLPEDADQLVFKAIQTYDNKEIVRWIQTQEKGRPEPENPAPVLELSPAAEEGQAAQQTSDDPKSEDSSSGSAKESTASADSSDTTARVLGIAGIVIGVLGVAFGVLAGRRRNAG